jgi:hypothetical protein
MKEANAFRDGPEMAEVIKSVSRRLGFTNNITYGMYVYQSEIQLLGKGEHCVIINIMIYFIHIVLLF